MSTIEIREKLHEYIDKSEDDIVNAVFALFKTYNNSSKMSREEIGEYNKEIDEAMIEINNGNFTTHEEVETIIKKRYEKASMVEKSYEKL
jgi:predicted transcriptional regulator